MLESCDNRAGGKEKCPTRRATVRCQPPSVKATALYLLNSRRRKSWGKHALTLEEIAGPLADRLRGLGSHHLARRRGLTPVSTAFFLSAAH
jgi:hypothetical protein